MKARIKLTSIFFLFLSSIFLSVSMLTTGHNWGDDFSSYIMQARSISEESQEKFVTDNRFTIDNSARPMGPVAYPWGTPVLLSPFYKIYGLNLPALKLRWPGLVRQPEG
jgi:hypothetical protein